MTDPAITETPEGALAAYHGAVTQFRYAFGGTENSFITSAGLLSDELVNPGGSEVDRRNLPSNVSDYGSAETYSRLQKARGQASQAIGLLMRYRPEEPMLAGRLYALAGYTEIFLADLFCSGVPLSTLDFDGDYTYKPGSSTQEVLDHARALFDTALALGDGDARVVALAHVGQARVLLAEGQFGAAAAAAALVSDGYRDTLTFTVSTDTTKANAPNFASGGAAWSYSVADREGFRGLNYASSADPRIPVTPIGTVVGLGTLWYPASYLADGSSSIVLASAVEARLIEAEALLQAGDVTAWRDKLNALRTDGTFDTQPTADPNDDPAALDTLWHAGSGGVDSLAPLEDPGATLTGTAADSTRVDLLFRERAFWLFLTGHRQGDLRRLLRQYSQYWPTQDRVYPIGAYPRRFTSSQYESDVTAPIPTEEQVLNPHFTGCLSRQA